MYDYDYVVSIHVRRNEIGQVSLRGSAIVGAEVRPSVCGVCSLGVILLHVVGSGGRGAVGATPAPTCVGLHYVLLLLWRPKQHLQIVIDFANF